MPKKLSLHILTIKRKLKKKNKGFGEDDIE